MRTSLASKPWEELPPEVARILRPQLSGLTEEIIDAVVATVPAYARPLQGEFGRGIREGVEQALRHFVELVEQHRADDEAGREIYRALGRGERREGRSLDALQSAYRIGARVAWRRFAEAGTDAGLEPAVLQQLADSIFAYIDELSAESVEGYAQAQAESAGERERRRQALVRVLIGEAPDEQTVRAAAGRAGWVVPTQLAAVAVASLSPGGLNARLGEEALTAPDGALGIALWPDPDGPGRRRLLHGAIGDRAGIGPAVPWRLAAWSLELAKRCLTLGERGALGPGPWPAEDHLLAIALEGERGVLSQLAGQRLAPFDELTEAARDRLQETLLAWLQLNGHRPSVAQALHIHPQTVRYRVGQLRELLGDALDHPEARLELELALRSTRLGA